MFLTSWGTFWRHDMFWTSWQTFYFMTNVLSSWRILSLFREQNIMKTWFRYNDKICDVMKCFWCHDKNFVVMACFWLYNKLFDIMTYFWLHDKVFTSWHMFYFMTTFLHHDIFLTKIVTSWQSMWRQYVFFTSNFLISLYGAFLMWQTVWRHDVCCTYWRHDGCFDAMKLFDDMTHLLTSTPWQTFDIMTCFWCHDKLYKVMTNLLSSWHVFDITTNFFDVHVKLFDVMICFWHHDEL